MQQEKGLLGDYPQNTNVWNKSDTKPIKVEQLRTQESNARPHDLLPLKILNLWLDSWMPPYKVKVYVIK